jgi:hypothetical protein
MLEVEHVNHSKIHRIFGACKTKGFAAVKIEKFSHAPKIVDFRGLFVKKVDQKRLINNHRCNKC